MKISYLLILLFVLSFFTLGQSIYKEHGEDYDIQNLTNKLNWNSSLFNINNSNEFINFEEVKTNRLRNIINKFIDFTGFTLFEVSKFGIEYGYENQTNIDFMNLMYYIKWILYVWLFSMIAPLIIPIIAIIYIFINWIKNKMY